MLGACWLSAGCYSYITAFLLLGSSPEQQQLGSEHHSSNLVFNSDCCVLAQHSALLYALRCACFCCFWERLIMEGCTIVLASEIENC